jgi:hypothetical protein
MNCELCRSEMYAWKPDAESASFQSLFDHLAKCPECTRQFALLKSREEAVHRTFQKVPESHLLESRILAGLAHERAQSASPRRLWRSWLLVPIAVAMLLVIAAGLFTRLEEWRLGEDAAGLIGAPPALQIVSNDRNELLQWSVGVLHGTSTLPSRLDRVEFRGATAVRVADHEAVLLKMKNEHRASLLILDARITHQSGIKSMHERTGSAAVWSDQQRTYVLLFDGSMQDMHAYMDQMGIGA